MSLTATIDATTESTKTASNRVADAARGGAETAKSMAKDVVATATAAVERQGTKATNAMRHAGETAQANVETANRGGAALAAFWLKVMQEQTAQNIEAMRNLAAARTWEEKLAVQSSFLSGSLARMQDVFARYMELTRSMTSDVLASGAGDADKVA